jgi:hypothetical protein
MSDNLIGTIGDNTALGVCMSSFHLLYLSGSVGAIIVLVSVLSSTTHPLPSFPGSALGVGMFALNFLVGGSGFARNNKR